MMMLATTIALAAQLLCAADASVGDFPRLGGETGDSLRIMRAVNAAGKGGVVWFPRGEYDIDSMLVVTGGQFSKCSPNATLYSCCEKAGELVWRDNSAGGFTEKEMAGLSAKLGKPACSGTSAVLKLAE